MKNIKPELTSGFAAETGSYNSTLNVLHLQLYKIVSAAIKIN